MFEYKNIIVTKGFLCLSLSLFIYLFIYESLPYNYLMHVRQEYYTQGNTIYTYTLLFLISVISILKIHRNCLTLTILSCHQFQSSLSFTFFFFLTRHCFFFFIFLNAFLVFGLYVYDSVGGDWFGNFWTWDIWIRCFELCLVGMKVVKG